MTNIHRIMFFFFNDTATTEIYTLSLHDALPISSDQADSAAPSADATPGAPGDTRSEEHTSELQSRENLVCRLLLAKKKTNTCLRLGAPYYNSDEELGHAIVVLDHVLTCLRILRLDTVYEFPCDTSLFLFFNDSATTEIYTLSLHDALPIFHELVDDRRGRLGTGQAIGPMVHLEDRKSTRLNSSHVKISYAVFCLKKKN